MQTIPHDLLEQQLTASKTIDWGSLKAGRDMKLNKEFKYPFSLSIPDILDRLPKQTDGFSTIWEEQKLLHVLLQKDVLRKMSTFTTRASISTSLSDECLYNSPEHNRRLDSFMPQTSNMIWKMY